MSAYIDSKVVEVPDACRSGTDVRYGFVDDQWVVLAHVVGIIVRIRIVVSLIAIRGHIFLISSPADVLLVEQVRNSGYVGGNVRQGVSSQTKEVTTNRGEVVWFTWMGYTVVPGQGNTLLSEGLEDWVRGCRGEVRVLQPDLNEAVKHQSGNDGRVGDGGVCSTDIE